MPQNIQNVINQFINRFSQFYNRCSRVINYSLPLGQLGLLYYIPDHNVINILNPPQHVDLVHNIINNPLDISV